MRTHHNNGTQHQKRIAKWAFFTLLVITIIHLNFKVIRHAIASSPTSSLELCSSQATKAYITDHELDMAGSSDVVEEAPMMPLMDHVYPRDMIERQEHKSDGGDDGEEWEIEVEAEDTELEIGNVTENSEDDDYPAGDESDDYIEILFIPDDADSSEDDDSDDIEISFVPDRDSSDDDDYSADDVINATDVSSDYSIRKRRRLVTRWPEVGWWDNPEECLAKPEDEKEECKGNEKMHIIAIAAGSFTGLCGLLLVVIHGVTSVRNRRLVPNDLKAILIEAGKFPSTLQSPYSLRMDGCEDPEKATGGIMPIRGAGATPNAVLHIGEDAALARNSKKQFITADGSHDGWTLWISQKRNKATLNSNLGSLTPPNYPPRIPSLNLPQSVLATVRKVSGLGPRQGDSDGEKLSWKRSESNAKLSKARRGSCV